MNEPTEEFYKALTERMEATDNDHDRLAAFNAVHEEFGVDPEDANKVSLDSWAVRIQCTPPEMEEELEATRFLTMLTPQELQAIMLAQSEHGRHLLSLDEFGKVREVHAGAMRRLTESGMAAFSALEELYAKYHDRFVAVAEEQQKQIEEEVDE